MLHTQLHGTHWQIGFQLGAGLARDGHFYPGRCSLSHHPGAAGVCPDLPAPLPPVVSPPPWRSCGGWPRGRGVPRTNWPGSSSPCTPCRPAPAAPALPCAGGEGPCSAGTATFSRSWKSTTPTAYTVFPTAAILLWATPPPSSRWRTASISSDWRRDSPRCPPAHPPRAECWSDPAAPAGILPGCSPRPCCCSSSSPSPPATRWCCRPGWAYRPGGVCPGAHPDPLSRGDGRLRLLRQFLPPLRHGPLPPADRRRLAGGRALSDPHPLPGRLGPGARPPSWTGPALRQDGLPVPV